MATAVFQVSSVVRGGRHYCLSGICMLGLPQVLAVLHFTADPAHYGSALFMRVDEKKAGGALRFVFLLKVITFVPLLHLHCGYNHYESLFLYGSTLWAASSISRVVGRDDRNVCV